jgi:hypothetical protein
MSQTKWIMRPMSEALHSFEKHDDKIDFSQFTLSPAVFFDEQWLDDKGE